MGLLKRDGWSKSGLNKLSVKQKIKTLTAVGFEPTPFRTRA